MDKIPKTQVNPFGVSRVDNPFQNHSDLKTIYSNEFNRLKSILADIKNDKNFQSRGVVVTGLTGSGKLSIEDEPLMIIFDQLEGLKYNEQLLFGFGRCIKEIFCSLIPNTALALRPIPRSKTTSALKSGTPCQG